MRAQAQPATTGAIDDPEAAAEQVRALQFSRDFELAAQRGAELLEQYPDHLPLRAWYLVSKGRGNEADAAITTAEQMVANHPESPWSYFALAGALNWHDERGEEAVAAIDEALSRAPKHPDFLWMKAEALLGQVEPKDVVAFVDSAQAHVENPAELLAMKGYALYVAARETENDDDTTSDQPTFNDALAAYQAARAADPSCVDAFYLPGYQLLFRQRTYEAYPLLKEAARQSTAVRIHTRYWRSVMNRKTIPIEDKHAEVETGIQGLIGRRPVTPAMLQNIANQYGQMEIKEKQRTYEARILEEYPRSDAAEWMLVNRYRRYSDEHRKTLTEERDPAVVATYRTMLWEFINRPHHNQENLLGDAYRSLYYTFRDDSTVSRDTLLQVVKGMVDHEGINPHVTHAGGAILLAERGIDFRYAEQIAREGVELAREKINEQHERGVYDTELEYEESMGWYTGIMYDALGWVYFHEGRRSDAERELLRAHEIDDDNRDNLYHLGQFYQETGDLAKAEQYYAAGLASQRPGENPNEAALEDLYRERHGSLDEYDTYVAELKDEHRARRKEEVLAARLDEPKPLPPFDLSTLDGETFSSEQLDGTITVINFWGVWCGWCVREMPDLQAFREKYQDDPQVRLVTINYRDQPEKARAWVAEKGYEFPVLLDNGYVGESGVEAFPTTWFVGPDGRIHFIKRGWSKKLVEEFTWRIEAIQASR